MSQSNNTGLWSWITTVDHKRIAIMYGAASLLFLIFGGVEAMLNESATYRSKQRLCLQLELLTQWLLCTVQQ